ncbi:MarR family winged helix-turn-helix transcriptional regulator [Pseudooceanicola spongiae]|jgi:DNA-binding MarR family transcriptional regulator|uniref:Winged helix DNA-binding protein n=1 Tax=Pseudooceanicola spongiae TaxID=2613965 RepID=A0A7L9WNS3_9RHOB|nr:winged helix DNA-binding protein [Pseudooceanicola spongiae]QOL81168.1 winged helix DNA-binding protein [Pseudooceanicola spongiae]
MADFLAHAGIPAAVTDQALAIDAILQQWRRRVGKRELGRMALAELGLDIDLPKLDVLIATWAPSNEFGADKGETMVSTIATRLCIDPSRASRLVSELINQGLLARGVSQQDARRTIVELTEKGLATVDAVRTIKFLILGDYLKGWTEAEIDTFLPLLERFSSWSEEAADKGQTLLAPTIAELRAKLQKLSQ